ncbi:MAG: hypothetical protein R2771_02380 [Saprospiraceae bacterium]
MKFKILLFSLFISIEIFGQHYTDFGQFNGTDSTSLPIGKLLTDGENRYIIKIYSYIEKGEKLYYNDKLIYEFEENITTKKRIIVIKIDEHNNFLSLVAFDDYNKYIEKIKFIEGELYYLAYGSSGYYIKKYIGNGVSEVVFSYTKGDKVIVQDYQKRGNELIVMGNFNAWQESMEILGDTLRHSNFSETGLGNTVFYYSIDLKNERVNYRFGYGGPVYETFITDVQIDSQNNTVIYGLYQSPETVVLGDTLGYVGGYQGTDAYIIRLDEKGNLISTNSFSSASVRDDIRNVHLSKDGSYYASLYTDVYGELLIDGKIYNEMNELRSMGYFVKFNEAGTLQWIDRINIDGGGHEFKIMYETERSIYAGGDFYIHDKLMEFNGETIQHETGNITMSVILELDKETGELKRMSDIISNGKDIRIENSMQLGEIKSIVFKASQENQIILNGDTIIPY